MGFFVRILVGIFFVLCVTESYRILVLFPFPTQSHRILGDGYVRLLLERGHQVTYITPFPWKETHDNFRQIDVSFNKFSDSVGDIEVNMKKQMISDQSTLMTMFTDMSIAVLESENVQKLLHDPEQYFDVVIIEWVYSELYAGLSVVFDCPFIWSASTEPHPYILGLIDEESNPSYVPNIISRSIWPLDFYERQQELWTQYMATFLRTFGNNESGHYIRIFKLVVEKKGKVLPPFGSVKYNASLVLGNSHESLGQAIKLPRNYIPIGGYHIKNYLEPLPQELQDAMDNAMNGVIYFSMGSSLRSKTFPEKIKKDLINMFGELEQMVIWKYEEPLQNLPKNLHVIKWAPQTSILSHKNCRLFIMQGGILSMTEAVYFGKPIIGIPIGSDQFVNIKRAVRKGFAKKVDNFVNLVINLKLAIEDVLDNPKFSEKAKELSMIYHDRPTPPHKELVYWVEHVVRTRGAAHLRSPALLVPWYQKMYLDLIFLFITVLMIVKHAIKKIAHKTYNKTNKID